MKKMHLKTLSIQKNLNIFSFSIYKIIKSYKMKKKVYPKGHVKKTPWYYRSWVIGKL